MSQIATQDGYPIYKQPLPPGCGGDDVVFWRAPLASDADGSETAYGPNNRGTDFTANAGHPGDWWAVDTEHGQPVVEDGYYVSETSLQDPDYPADDRRRYVDAQSVPFVVLPTAHFKEWGTKLGDVAWVQRLDEHHNVLAECAAIFADAGPSVGEGSCALLRALGGNPDPRHGGISAAVVQVFVFCGSGDGRPLPVEEIDRRARALLPALRSVPGLATPIVA